MADGRLGLEILQLEPDELFYILSNIDDSGDRGSGCLHECCCYYLIESAAGGSLAVT